MMDGTVLPASIATKLLGGLSTVYVAGYLVLTSHYAAFRIPLSLSLFNDAYLVAGARFMGVVIGQLYMGLLAVLAIYPVFHVLRKVSWSPERVTRMRRLESSLARPLHWFGTALTAWSCIFIASFIREGRTAGVFCFELAVVLTLASTLVWWWLRQVADSSLQLTALALTVLSLVLLPVAYGTLAKPGIVPRADLQLKVGALRRSGGLILEGAERVALIDAGGALHLLSLEDVAETSVHGCWHLGERRAVACPEGTR